MQENDVNFWKKIQIGSFIRINDFYTILANSNNGNDGVCESVKSLQTIKSIDNLFEIFLYELETCYLVIKSVDNQFDIRIYREFNEIGFWESGNRKFLKKKSYFAPFSAPENEDSFKMNELNFSESIGLDCRNYETDEINTWEFSQKNSGELVGVSNFSPERSGVDSNIFTTVIEYQSEDQCPTPELLLLEVGGINTSEPDRKGTGSYIGDEEEFIDVSPTLSEDGGYITLYLGYNVNIKDVEVI